MTILLFLLPLAALTGYSSAQMTCGNSRYRDRLSSEFCIEDDASKGFVLGKVVSEKKLRDELGNDWEKAQFSLMNTGRQVVKYFKLDKKKGRLTLARNIDRDKLCEEVKECCKAERECRIVLKVIVTAPLFERPIIESVPIRVIDKNDHAPRFPNTREVIHISENARRGYEVALPLAKDPDALQLSVQDYFVPNEAMPIEFELDKRPNSLHPSSGNYRKISQLFLKLTRSLDRERRANYTFPLVAVDGGTKKFSGTTTIVVKVDDHNDNGPKFLKQTYEATVDEGKTDHQPLVTVEARDPDHGENSITSYAFAPTVNDDTRRLFEVMPNSGKIFLRQPLDYEKSPRHRFMVVAIDKAGHADTATTTVTVIVKDRNDEKPEIKLSFVTGERSGSSSKTGRKVARIRENYSQRQLVGVIQVSDKDRGLNGRVNCSLGNHRSDFLLEAGQQERDTQSRYYMVYTARSLDREKQSRIDLQINCEDQGRQMKQRTSLLLPIELLDENDNAPQVRLPGTQSRTTVTVRENKAKGTQVVQVLGVDPDEAENGKLAFSMSQSDRLTQSLFRIDPVTGWITTRQQIDREHGEQPIDRLPLVVTVEDHGKPPRTSTLSLTIRIEDVNDNAPVFTENPMYFSLKENQPERYRVGEIRLVDKDVSDAITVRLDYTRNGGTFPFRVTRDGDKFYLNTTASLDRERLSEYKFFIIAEDITPSGSHRTSGEVHVTVEDVNDNTPQIIFPRLNNKTIRLSYREQKGFEVLSINARDNDDSGKCLFELTPETTDILEIDPRTGTIRVRRSIHENDIGAHKVGVVVRDNGHPARESYVKFVLLVDRSKPHRSHREQPILPPMRPGLSWRSDITLIIVLALIILLLLGIVILIIYVRHWRQGFLFLPDLLAPCHEPDSDQKHRRNQSPDLMKPDVNTGKYLHDGATLGRGADFKMRPGDSKEASKAGSDTCSFSGLYSGTPTRQPAGVTTPFLARDNSKYESLAQFMRESFHEEREYYNAGGLTSSVSSYYYPPPEYFDPQRQAFLQQQQSRVHLQQHLATAPRGRGSLPDAGKSVGPDLTKRDYDSLLRGPVDHYHVYQTISPGEALIDDTCDAMDLPPGATLGKRHHALRRQASSQSRPTRYNSEGDLTAGIPVEEHVGPRNASVKFVFPPKSEQVYTKTYPVMQTSFV